MKIAKLFFLTAALLVTTAALADWTAPPTAPPTCPDYNPACNAPITASDYPQIKRGALGIGVNLPAAPGTEGWYARLLVKENVQDYAAISGQNRATGGIGLEGTGAEVGVEAVVSSNNGIGFFQWSEMGVTGAKNFFQNGLAIGTGEWVGDVSLDLGDKIRIRGGAPGLGKVLQSDSTGLATWVATSTLGIVGGGGGMPNPMTTIGDIIYGSTTGTSSTPARLGGTAGFLKSTGAAAPAWSSVNLGTGDVTGALTAAKGGTGQSNYAVGDIIYASGVSTLARRAIGTAGQVLTVSTGLLPTWAAAPSGGPGSGTVNKLPKWGTVNTLADSNVADDGSSVSVAGSLSTTGGALLNTGGAANGLIVSAGNVGIGTTEPGAKLQVSGTGTGVRVDGQQSSQTALSIGGQGEVAVDAPGVPGGRFFIGSNGNVGIGVTDPSSRLHVRGGGAWLQDVGSSPSLLTVGPGGNGINYIQSGINGTTGSQADLRFTNLLANRTNMVIQADGKVGIGTTGPGARLTVRDSTAGTVFAIRNTADTTNTFTISDAGSITAGSVPWARLASFPSSCGLDQYVTAIGSSLTCSTPASSDGTVRSVGLTLPAQFSVTGSPVTTVGTLAGSWVFQSANRVFASPDGGTGTPTFRALVAADIPNLDAAKITSGTVATARLGSGAASGSTFLRGDQTWQTPGSGADNLGNHIATQALNMSNFAISSLGSITTNVGANFDIGYGQANNFYIKSNTSAGSVNIGSGGNVPLNVSGNVGIGTASPGARLEVSGNGVNTDNTSVRLTNTAAGGKTYSLSSGIRQVSEDGFSIRDVTAGTIPFVIDRSGNVALTGNLSTPGTISADVFNGRAIILSGGGQISGDLTIVGPLTLTTLGPANGPVSLCRNSSNQLSSCSSSIRYKKDVADLSSGLETIQKLRPVTFTWKQGGKKDLGLIAEEVYKVNPLLVTYDDKQQIEGVKYDKLSAVLVNAIKEQQKQIEQLKQRVSDLEAKIAK